MVCNLYLCAHAQRIEIAAVKASETNITIDTSKLTTAIHRSMADGTRIQSFAIQSEGSQSYLVCYGIQRNFKRMVAFSLKYDMRTRIYYIDETAVSTDACTAAACNDCTFFKENGKIRGCKCSEKSTISNQCNYTFIPASGLYLHLVKLLH
jgi:hypothetical protein